MNEIEKRARELLALEFEKEGWDYPAADLRNEVYRGLQTEIALRAVMAALAQRQSEVDSLRQGCHRLKQQSLRRARTIKVRNREIRELRAAQEQSAPVSISILPQASQP